MNDADYAQVLERLWQHVWPVALQRRTKPRDRRESWYYRSYAEFLNPPAPETPAALVRVLGAAGSWVNVIVSGAPTEDQSVVSSLTDALNELEGANVDNSTGPRRDAKRREVLARARAAFGLADTGDRVVMLSKALHFLRPSLAPMIDTNVGRAWGRLRAVFPRIEPDTLLTRVSGRAEPLPIDEDYLRYWEVAFQLVRVARQPSGWPAGAETMTYRLLDELLFRLGKENLPL